MRTARSAACGKAKPVTAQGGAVRRSGIRGRAGALSAAVVRRSGRCHCESRDALHACSSCTTCGVPASADPMPACSCCPARSMCALDVLVDASTRRLQRPFAVGMSDRTVALTCLYKSFNKSDGGRLVSRVYWRKYRTLVMSLVTARSMRRRFVRHDCATRDTRTDAATRSRDRCAIGRQCSPHPEPLMNADDASPTATVQDAASTHHVLRASRSATHATDA